MSAILGISAYYHDASAAIVVNREIVAAAAEERFTRLKHDSSFPSYAIQFCLDRAGFTAQELDAVVFYEDPALKFTRVMAATLAEFPNSCGQFVTAVRGWLKNKLWICNQISRELNIHPKKVRFTRHHESHLAQAFLSSPFDEAAILTIDAVGEWTSTAMALGQRHGQQPFKHILALEYPHSLGLVYAAFTAFLGFRPNSGEASTMALAAFGKPRYADEVRRILRAESDDLYSVDTRYFRFLESGGRLFTNEFIRLFGPPRDFRSKLSFDCLISLDSQAAHADDQRHADIAASLQLVLEETVLALAQHAWRVTRSRNLCLAGGVALNAVLNHRLIRESPFEQVFIPPDPGDGGAALGAALLHCARTQPPDHNFTFSPWLGDSFTHNETQSIIRNADPTDWQAFKANPQLPEIDDLTEAEFSSFDELVDLVSEVLQFGGIVGWVQGRFELGPRALGNRSILADPGNLDTVRRLSARVKRRDAFRPYALSIRAEDAQQCCHFELGVPMPARWMLSVEPVKKSAIEAVRGAVHVDGTTRVQVCSSEENPRFHQLLSAFARRTGLGVLLNTSFNEAGFPMVASPVEALLMFARTEMDVLVVGNWMVRRNEQSKRKTWIAPVAERSSYAVGYGGANN